MFRFSTFARRLLGSNRGRTAKVTRPTQRRLFPLGMGGLLMSLELSQKSHITMGERAKVGDLVLNHHHSLYAESEGEALVFVGINAAVLQHIGVHHAAAGNF